MRVSSCRLAPFWFTALCILPALLATAPLASAQQAAGQKRKLSPQSLLNRPTLVTMTARGTKPNAPPPASTDTWTGGGSNSNWSNASNWNNGAITSGENILINTVEYFQKARNVERDPRVAVAVFDWFIANQLEAIRRIVGRATAFDGDVHKVDYVHLSITMQWVS